jgi:hypothetical protein
VPSSQSIAGSNQLDRLDQRCILSASGVPTETGPERIIVLHQLCELHAF